MRVYDISYIGGFAALVAVNSEVMAWRPVIFRLGISLFALAMAAKCSQIAALRCNRRAAQFQSLRGGNGNSACCCIGPLRKAKGIAMTDNTQTPLERAARALALAQGDEPDEFSHIAKVPVWHLYLDQARAVLLAIREPSEAMIEAYDAHDAALGE